MFIIIALVVVLIAIVVDWQKDKTSFLAAVKSNWLKYLAILVTVSLLTGYLLDLAAARYIFAACAGAAVYLGWTLIVNLFKPKH